MQVALTVSPSDPRTLQEQVFDQIRAMILSGRLRGGDPVPGSRALAEQLGVSRNTVTIAYDKLLSEGYLEIQPNVGTFVARDLPDFVLGPGGARTVRPAGRPAPRSTLLGAVAAADFPVQAISNPAAARLSVDFWVGRVDARSFPGTEWRRMFDVKLRCGGMAFAQYGDPQGFEPLRRAIADHVGPARGVGCTPQEVVVVGGSQDGLMLIARAVAGRCGTFLHENPCYQGSRYLF
ncbi:MAG TPA: GntR family transcriptional regulator, partial [Amaricoccus sp.]|uniref:GntR family transcriptional regulator n=1 Tax=Amaricoccus sp. TaxID=1872485 RepID=UPI002BCB5201